MLDQHCIAETLSHSEAVETLRVLRTQAGDTSRSAFARHVCREFGFVNSRGQPQVASCQKALRSLHSAGRIDLPAPRHGGRAGDCRPRRLGQPVPPPQAVPPAAGAVAGLKLTLVTSPQQRRTWNELVASEHPQGAVLHVGAQLRYLIESEHGLLGALGFAAAALAVAARDEWIGWDAQLRRKRLHRVLGLSRFLIRPSVRCHLLASKVLGMVRRRLPEDFLQRYGYRPALLETYCDPQQHAGTCFRAANWTCVGQTGGRGRFARPGQRVPVKAIFVYPLQRDWRRLLGAAAAPPGQPLGPADGLALDEFAANELGQAPLGDLRLSKRLVQTAQMQAAAPMASIPAAAQGLRAAVKGHYRLIDQPDDSAVTPQNILAPHRQRTLRRLQAERTVLCVQDGTELNFAEHPGCAGLGYIGKNKRSEGTLGLHMHSTLAVSPEGIPLGLLQIQYDAPDGQAQRGRPLEERKTFRWIRGLRDCAEVAGQLAGPRLVAVMDREADVQALFAEQRRLEGVELLVRAKHNRSLGKDVPKLFEHMRAQAVGGQLEIKVQRTVGAAGHAPTVRQRAARGAHGAGRVALADGRVAGPGARRGSAADAAGARVGAGGAGGGGSVGVVPADDVAGGVAGGCGAGAGVVPAALAHRGLAPDAQVRLQGGVPGAPHGAADRAGGDDQGGDRLAAGRDDPAGTGDARITERGVLHADPAAGAAPLRVQARAGRAGQSGTGGADHGDLGRLPVPCARSAAGPSKDLGGLDPLDHHERSL